MGFVLYLMLNLCSIAQLVSTDRFLVAAPSVFHVGVKEQVSVQVSESLLNKNVNCYLEQEVGHVFMSKQETVRITQKGKFESLWLEVLPEKYKSLSSPNAEPPYLNLVCDVGENKRKKTRVLVSQHRGYIFIQTNQPMYNPTQKVQYRIFTLDYSMRPITEHIHVRIINAEENTVKKMFINVKDGIYSNNFHLPDVSQPGVWKIKAHYIGDEKSPSFQEFKVQKFVLPSFDVTIKPEVGYLLVSSENFTFSIDVLYPYGKKITGGFHCRFGIRQNSKESNDIEFIRGLEVIGPVRDGKAEITIKISDLRQKLNSGVLESLAQEEAQFYIATTVTDTLTGEVQESEILLPIVSQRYTVNLSRTRSHYIPSVPFAVRVVVRTPNDLPAKGVQVEVGVSHSIEKLKTEKTDAEGSVVSIFNLEQTLTSLSVEVTVNGLKSTKNILPAYFSNNNFLLVSVSNQVLSPQDQMTVKFDIVNGQPEDGLVYFLVLSKGALRKTGSVKVDITAQVSFIISPDLVPSFRFIGYYYATNGEIIADSVWIDVKDVCEEKIEVTAEKEMSAHDYYQPGQFVDLNIDVGTQRHPSVALLVVDKAIYALKAQNKLTPKQVFSSMQSYDLGCSYGGGENTAAVFNDAGLSFISHSLTVRSQMRKGFSCESGFRRQRRSIDLQKEMVKKETEYTDKALKKCCRHGLTQIPMKLTCAERQKRMNKTESYACVDAFLKCCKFAAELREKKRREEMRRGYGRTAGASDSEDLFDNEIQYIRRSFPPSFEFKVIEANGKTKHKIFVPDSITTWEVQAVSVSSSHGFCVAEPLDIRVFKELFISMRLPYSVKPNEQMVIVVAIHNYGKRKKELAVHMKQVAGLCSPGASSVDSYIKLTLDENSSETVTFSAVPLITGEIPITIQLYDTEFAVGVDAIQKILLVMPEGVQMQEEKSYQHNLEDNNEVILHINGAFPRSAVPGTDTNLFVKVEGAYDTAAVMPLLSPPKVEQLVRAPFGCAEQTMIRMAPTSLAIYYLDHSNLWLELSTDSRDTALNYIKEAYDRILTFRKHDGSYGAWITDPSSNWLTALVVKVLSLVAKSQLAAAEREELISQRDIQISVKYIIQKQGSDGSFNDPNPVIHREMQGGIGEIEQEVSLTAFITIALNHSLPFLGQEKNDVESSIAQAIKYLLSHVTDLKRPFSVAITAYCLSTCLQDKKLALPAWEKLKSLAAKEGDCKVWRANVDMHLEDEIKSKEVSPAIALTVETTAYALLAAVAQGDFNEAKMAACFLSSQENYGGGFKSTQDTIIALEALSEYMLHKPEAPFSSFTVQFTSSKRKEKENLVLNKKGESVEQDLKRLLGNDIIAKISGKGEAKIKVAKAFYAKNPFESCSQLLITVTVHGKIEYTAHVIEAYDYYDYGENQNKKEEEDFPHSGIEWFDARSRRKRDTDQSLNSENPVIYEVCVSHTLGHNITGMAIADITLLSGFVANTEDLDKLKELSDKYISHYEVTKGRVLLYFNEIPEMKECIAFEAKQTVPIGLLQPAPATFYDYYEPDRRCSVLYAAPKRSKLVSVLCSGEVCQCAERACFKEKKAADSDIRKDDRFRHACYQPVADYGFVVSVISVEDKNNFELYTTSVNEVLKFNQDVSVTPDDIRVFAKRKNCKGQLETGESYLIMGTDGSTTDSKGEMLYLLDSNTWIEQKLKKDICRSTKIQNYCREFKEFLREYQINGCSQ